MRAVICEMDISLNKAGLKLKFTRSKFLNRETLHDNISLQSTKVDKIEEKFFKPKIIRETKLEISYL